MAFKALWITEDSNGKISREIKKREIADLPDGDVLIRVHYSGLNFKDALSASGNKGITRKYPHTPGIDAAGIVEQTNNAEFPVGAEVFVSGYDLGMNTSGGFAQYVRVPAPWIINKPANLSFKDVMTIGTAGFTAAVALRKMELLGQVPAAGPLVITGSTGGVGSFAVLLAASAGYQTIAITGKTNANEYLHSLGATTIESRSFVDDKSGKALIRPQWAGGIETIGGNILQTLLKGCKPEGTIACTGLVASNLLEGTVFPFILNGVNLVGVGSAEMPIGKKKEIWNQLANNKILLGNLSAIATEVSLDELNEVYIEKMLQGEIMGRIVVNTQL
ncbi:MAG: YhdH/YhfP family quinone oxidoreductase [Chitinophagaceae bacterium]|nr:YhdH/YhfP family quinone oxidoreductase [Chitinophagaceae bacterium]